MERENTRMNPVVLGSIGDNSMKSMFFNMYINTCRYRNKYNVHICIIYAYFYFLSLSLSGPGSSDSPRAFSIHSTQVLMSKCHLSLKEKARLFGKMADSKAWTGKIIQKHL